MATKVETFECIETVAGEQAAPDAEAIALIEKLGLAGQKGLIGEDGKTRCPYRPMTKAEQFTYNTLLTERRKLEEYAGDTIPLRVLQVAAHARTLGIFKRLEVWAAPVAAEIKDPVLVGVKGDGQYSEIPYILARWGDALESFAWLHAAALKCWKEDMTNRLMAVKAAVLADLENMNNVKEGYVPAKSHLTYYGAFKDNSF